jgi:hypothetical protein
MDDRQTAFLCDFLERNGAIEVSAEQFLGVAHLPECEPPTHGPQDRPQPAASLGDMHADREADMINEKSVGLVGKSKSSK